jgi:hypothetical protein
MHLGVREDKDQGRTRTVVWSDGSETDLGYFVALAVAASVLLAAVLGTIEFRGVPHVVSLVVAIVAGVVTALLLVPFLLVLGGFFVVKGLLARQPTAAQRASWVVVAAGFGGLVGLDAYGVGVSGLLTGPLLLAAGVAAAHTAPRMSARARTRVRLMSAVAAVAALAAGLTIFL